MTKSPSSLSRALSAVLRTARSTVDRQPVWATPHQWADADGMYAGNGQVWLYRQLPPQVLYDLPALGNLLSTWHAGMGEREVHLLLHTWERPSEPPAGTPAALATFQSRAIGFLVPVRHALVGIRLTAAQTATELMTELDDTIDTLLAEDVPDFPAYDDDRARVTRTLAESGATALDRTTSGSLESWYTLGSPVDVAVTERDDRVSVPGGAVIEMATAGPIDDHPSAGRVPGAGNRGATVVSIRGTLTSEGLTRTSVVYGRRAEAPTVPWPVALRDLPAVTPRPLPLRQLTALDETLPCSLRRVDPSHLKVDAERLRALGFTDTLPAGAESGLLMGIGGPTMTRPVHMNPFGGNGVALLAGDTGCGKSFLAELLATQAQLGGIAVTVVGVGDRTGRGFAALTRAATWRPAGAGDLDPFRWMPAADALALHQALAQVVPAGLTAAEEAGVTAGFTRAARTGAADLISALALSDSTTGVAKLRRALARHPIAGLLVSPGPVAAAALPSALAVDLAAVADDPAMTALAAATVLGSAVRRARGPHLVVLDGLDHALAHPGLAGWIAEAARSAQVAVLVTVRSLDAYPPGGPRPAHMVAMAGSDPRLLEAVGKEPTPSNLQWLADAVPGGTGIGSAACVYRPPAGASFGVQVGPWPADVTTALTSPTS